MSAYDELREAKDFFSSYFHEDWSEEANDPTGVLARYMAQAPKADVLRRLVRGIQLFVGREASEEMLEQALLRDLGCYYSPSAEQKTTRQWLEEVAAALSAEAERISRES